MKTKTFLNMIHDSNHRLFPIHYKDVKIISTKNDCKSLCFAINDYQTTSCCSYNFYKPISRFL